MNQSPDPSQGAAESASPYERLGVATDASFDEVQAARQARLAELGDDPMACARIEAAYDAVLMERLKERQQGRVSSAARSASQREQLPSPPPRLPLPSLPALQLPQLKASGQRLLRLELASGRDLWFPLVVDGVLLLLLLLGAAAPELLLALATGVCLTNLQRRHGRFLAAVGWSFALLALGLLLGGLLSGQLDAGLPLGLPLQSQQVQSLPAWLLLLLGALLLG